MWHLFWRHLLLSWMFFPIRQLVYTTPSRSSDKNMRFKILINNYKLSFYLLIFWEELDWSCFIKEKRVDPLDVLDRDLGALSLLANLEKNIFFVKQIITIRKYFVFRLYTFYYLWTYCSIVQFKVVLVGPMSVNFNFI